MRYYKNINDGYILSIGIGSGFIEITKEEYENISEIIKNHECVSGKGYKLTTDLTWEEYELPPITEEIEATDDEYSEAGKILLGVSE